MTTSVERENVHEVYDEIAIHFSETRYKPWPLVQKFLESRPVGSLIADVGCGNGKYMKSNPHAYFLGCDRSRNLIGICGQRGLESMVADGLSLPYRDNAFDAVISIAVVHHYSTVENRIIAIREMTRILRPGGQMVITCWAFEQKKKKYAEQDVMIPWHLQKRFEIDQSDPTDNTESKVYHRYYHLFKEGELEDLISNIEELKVVESYWDVDNWYVCAEKKGE